VVIPHIGITNSKLSPTLFFLPFFQEPLRGCSGFPPLTRPPPFFFLTFFLAGASSRFWVRAEFSPGCAGPWALPLAFFFSLPYFSRARPLFRMQRLFYAPSEDLGMFGSFPPLLAFPFSFPPPPPPSCAKGPPLHADFEIEEEFLFLSWIGAGNVSFLWTMAPEPLRFLSFFPSFSFPLRHFGSAR